MNVLQAPCKVGDNISLVRMGDDPDPIAPGATGAVSRVYHWAAGQWHIEVNWDNGRTLGLIYPVDQFTVRKV